MRLFRTAQRERAVTAMLRHMENRRFTAALRALKRYEEGPTPPPHALIRLGRWLIERGRARAALRPIRLFLRLYPGHQDRLQVLYDLVRALSAAGKTAAAKAAAEEAKRMVGAA